MPRLLIAGTVCVLVASCSNVDRDQQTSIQSAREINLILARWQKAFEARDLGAVVSFYAPGDEVTVFDAIPPLEVKGSDALKQDFAAYFAKFQGPLKLEFRDPHVKVSGDLAVAYGIQHITGKLKSGKDSDSWLRYTMVFERMSGKWMDIHDHVSVPIKIDRGHSTG
jgi:ketosteroid isomerase-like protein